MSGSEQGPSSARLWVAGGLGIGVFVAASLGSVALAPAPGLVILALAFALRGSFPWAWVPGYLAAQLFGALLGVWTVTALLPLPRPHERVVP